MVPTFLWPLSWPLALSSSCSRKTWTWPPSLCTKAWLSLGEWGFLLKLHSLWTTILSNSYFFLHLSSCTPTQLSLHLWNWFLPSSCHTNTLTQPPGRTWISFLDFQSYLFYLSTHHHNHNIPPVFLSLNKNFKCACNKIAPSNYHKNVYFSFWIHSFGNKKILSFAIFLVISHEACFISMKK